MNRAAWTYILIAYLVTWSITLTAYCLYRTGALTLDQLNLVYNVGAAGPLLGALISAKIYYGNSGIKKLFSTLSFKTLNKRALLIAFSPLVFLGIGLLLFPVFAGHWYTFSDTQEQFKLSTPISYLSWILPFITYSLLEEFGWRAFLLPHLQSRYTAFKSTMLLTAFWACWHLPFFLWRFQFSLFITIGFFFSIFIGALIITSIFNLGKGSIIPVIIFHLTNNIASAIDKKYLVAVVSTGFVLLALWIIRTYKTKDLADVPRVQNFYLSAK
ncbi:MAG: putative rane protein [Bacteroidetes bacterium]|nr:putative rane protein [Bacteroidota bacterium]